MATEPKSRRRRRKKVLRKNDGSLYDVTEGRRISPGELRDYVRDGGLFEARRQENGADCTYEVLQGVLGVGLLENMLPGMGGGSLPGLGGLGSLAGGGPLAALGGGGALSDLARLVSERVARSADSDDDWEVPRRRSHRRPSADWDRDDGDWSGASGRARRRRDSDWASDRDWGSDADRTSDPDWASDPDFE
ncbi:MAG: hypothetical protein AB1679_03600 [Actinomycetota bacterium]|jgi:hypothetical protein